MQQLRCLLARDRSNVRNAILAFMTLLHLLYLFLMNLYVLALSRAHLFTLGNQVVDEVLTYDLKFVLVALLVVI